MPSSTCYVVLLALVLGVGCASTNTTEEGSSSFNLDHLQMWPNLYEGEGPFVELPADIGGFLGIAGGMGVTAFYTGGWVGGPEGAAVLFAGGAAGWGVARPVAGLPFYMVKKLLHDTPKRLFLRKKTSPEIQSP